MADPAHQMIDKCNKCGFVSHQHGVVFNLYIKEVGQAEHIELCWRWAMSWYAGFCEWLQFGKLHKEL